MTAPPRGPDPDRGRGDDRPSPTPPPIKLLLQLKQQAALGLVPVGVAYERSDRLMDAIWADETLSAADRARAAACFDTLATMLVASADRRTTPSTEASFTAAERGRSRLRHAAGHAAPALPPAPPPAPPAPPLRLVPRELPIHHELAAHAPGASPLQPPQPGGFLPAAARLRAEPDDGVPRAHE